MTPREYIEAVVQPNLADLERNEGDIRHALNAVHAADALAARIFVAAGGEACTGAKDDTHYRKMLADQGGDFALLHDLAKAVKHAVLDRGSPIVGSASQVEVKAIGMGQAIWGEFGFGMPPQAVVILEDGTHRVIASVCRNALTFLEEEMARRWL